MKAVYFIIVTILFLVVMYILRVEKTSTSAMDWKSFKIDPKVVVISVLLYGLVLYEVKV